MHMKLLLCAFSAILVNYVVLGSGELSILHHPSSLIFKGHDPIRESLLKEVYSAAFGFSTEQNSNWQGMSIADPFSMPEAIVTVAIVGVADVGQVKGHHFPLRTDEDESNTYHDVERRISERYPEEKSHLVRIDLSDGLTDVHKYGIFHGIKNDKPQKSSHTHLRNSIDEEREFLKEITILNACIDKIEKNTVKPDYIPDIFWFTSKSLHPLYDLYGVNSTVVKQAKQVLNDAVLRLNNAFNKAYGGSVLVNVITSDAVHTRRTRSILEATAETPEVLNLAKEYGKDYSVIFNIILWFGVTMVFSLLAICIAIGDMDPGRDSIIYRMTSTRMKKDN